VGTVNTGAIDPLTETAAITAKFDAWFHIDGAYSALGPIAALHKFPGIDRADSISLDPHKWLYQSIDCGCLLYRDATAAQRAFSAAREDANYEVAPALLENNWIAAVSSSWISNTPCSLVVFSRSRT
jgi:glutamate/tyrosine decarboxylase-like PLP-dependent enzyme